MTAPTTFTLRCSPVQLAVLAALAGCRFLVGLPDPLGHLTAEDLETAQAAALRGLQADGHCGRDPAGRLRIAPRLQLLLDSLTRASSCLCVGVIGAREFYQAYYAGGPMVLRVAVDPVHGCLCTLGADGPEAVLAALEFPQPQPPAARSFELPAHALARLRAEAEFSLQEGMDEAVRMTGRREAAPFVRTLARPRRAGAVTVLRRFSEGGWLGEGLNFLEGGDDLWRLRPVRRGTEDWIEVCAVGGLTLAEDLQALARQFAPARGARA